MSKHTARVELIAPRPRFFDFYATAQVVYTLTSFPAITRVEPFVNGRHCCISTHQGKPIPVLTRADLANWQGARLGP